MRRRLYFLADNLQGARSVFNELLLARIHDNHIHLLAKEGTDLGDLPEASIFQKSDVVHSMLIGLMIGGLIGVIVGIIGHGALNSDLGGVMLATTGLGAVLGAWSATMIGMMVPNRQLKGFEAILEEGKILVMVDVPLGKVNDVKELLLSKGLPIEFAGLDPTVPSFP